MSIKDEPCSESSTQDSTTSPMTSKSQPQKKRSRIPVPCKSVPYHRPNPQPQNSPPIAMTRHIHKGDLVSLIFLNLLPQGEISFTDANPDSSENAPEIPECYRDLADIFLKEAHTLPPHQGRLDHHIPLMDDAKPTFGPIYNLSEMELKVLKNYIEEKLAKGWIHPSTSPFSSSVLFIKKPDGSLRLCVDYRALNQMTIKNRYPIPLTTEIMDRISKAKEFSRVDVR